MKQAKTPTVALIATLDTKGDEIAYIRDRIQEHGCDTLIVDSGILGMPGVDADITRESVVERAGLSLKNLQTAGSRGAAVELMQEALRSLARELYGGRLLDAALCIGGAEGAQLGAAFMQQLPVGVPKLIVSPSASGRREFGPFTGSTDMVVMHSVIDILGLNAVARSVFDNAAAAIAGMSHHAGGQPVSERPCVGVTMLGQTTPGASVLVSRLEDEGFEPIVFHANGVGGPAMDAMARDGSLAAVIDFTISELANTPFNGVHAVDDTRMTGAINAGIPLLVVPGAADFFNQGPFDTVPEAYRARQHYNHNPVATLLRIEESEMRSLARELSRRLDGATAPTSVIVPSQGFSLIGVDDEPLADHDADRAFADELRKVLPTSIGLEVVDYDVNDQRFADLVAEAFLQSYASWSTAKCSSRSASI